MTARDKILAAVSQNKPELLPMPEVNVQRTIDRSALLHDFIAILSKIGATPVVTGSVDEIATEVRGFLDAGENVVNTVGELAALNTDTLLASNATALEPVYRAYVEGEIGVAENGAIWIGESKMINRLLPFICQHLVIVLRADKIVADMHEAYRVIDVAREGYGVFLAGPSKTADIEQSLVIGAHGARSVVVYLLT